MISSKKKIKIIEHKKNINIQENFSETKDKTSKIKREHFILGTNDTEESMES